MKFLASCISFSYWLQVLNINCKAGKSFKWFFLAMTIYVSSSHYRDPVDRLVTRNQICLDVAAESEHNSTFVLECVSASASHCDLITMNWMNWVCDGTKRKKFSTINYSLYFLLSHLFLALHSSVFSPRIIAYVWEINFRIANYFSKYLDIINFPFIAQDNFTKPLFLLILLVDFSSARLLLHKHKINFKPFQGWFIYNDIFSFLFFISSRESFFSSVTDA